MPSGTNKYCRHYDMSSDSNTYYEISNMRIEFFQCYHILHKHHGIPPDSNKYYETPLDTNRYQQTPTDTMSHCERPSDITTYQWLLQVTNRYHENTITYHKTLWDIIRQDTTKFSLKVTLLPKPSWSQGCPFSSFSVEVCPDCPSRTSSSQEFFKIIHHLYHSPQHRPLLQSWPVCWTQRMRFRT